MNSEEFEEELWKENLYYEYKDKLELVNKEIERLNNKEEQIIRRLEDLIIIGEQVENEWAVDICKMIIKELKGENNEEN